MRKTGTERRNLLILVALTAGMAILVVLAQREGNLRIMPPEPAQLAAKRTSPDNAFFTLRSARDRAQKLIMEQESAQDEMAPATEVVGDRYDAVIDKARKALDNPYYLCPKIGDVRSTLSKDVNFQLLAHILAARALERARATGADTVVFQDLLDAIRLGRMVAGDGPVASYSAGCGMQLVALECFPECAARATSTEVLQSALDELSHLITPPVPTAGALEFRWRILDNSVALPRLVTQHAERRSGRRGYWRDFRYGWLVKRGQRLLRKHRARLSEMASLPYPDYDRQVWNWRELRHLSHPRCNVSAELGELVLWRALTDVWAQGTRLAIALEMHCRDRGAYPSTLNTLVPDYLEAIPADPLAGGSFVYRTEDSDYVLYSVGGDGRDNGGEYGGNDAGVWDVVIHKRHDEGEGALLTAEQPLSLYSQISATRTDRLKEGRARPIPPAQATRRQVEGARRRATRGQAESRR